MLTDIIVMPLRTLRDGMPGSEWTLIGEQLQP